jgi:hypothetical protein
MVFTARILIRLAGLMPEAIDLRRTAKELEALAVILQQGEVELQVSRTGHVLSFASAGTPPL